MYGLVELVNSAKFEFIGIAKKFCHQNFEGKKSCLMKMTNGSLTLCMITLSVCVCVRPRVRVRVCVCSI